METDLRRKTKRKERAIRLPVTFEPRTWLQTDRRTAIAREIIARVKALKESVGADSVQKEILAERAIFVALQLETAEVAAVEGKLFEPSIYTQQVNCLVGLLRVLGLERHAKDARTLGDYIKQRKERA